MANWGYAIHKDRQIDFDKNDRAVAKFVLEREPISGFAWLAERALRPVRLGI